jgi:two-component system, NtrC family, nitrogen regulation sensor histidine kinase NtrY
VPEDMEVSADEVQLEQALINLVRNAVEAMSGAEGSLTITASQQNGTATITIADDGPGIANVDNLFVPFFTTKPGGSGVGLLLSRQIAEAHGGTLTLGNRNDSRGAVATLRIPGSG